MRIGFDVDGVLASFETAYQDLIVEVTKRNLFPPLTPDGPPVWDWPEHYGYTDDEVSATWDVINGSNVFWESLDELPGMTTLASEWGRIGHRHDIYFVTARRGLRAKQQTEKWLTWRLRTPWTPTVLLASHKGVVARALRLEAFIDDDSGNVNAIAFESSGTRTYLLERAYNRTNASVRDVRRVSSVAAFLDAEWEHLIQ